MKSRRSRSRRLKVLHLWNFHEVQKAIPYLRSVVGSLREHWLGTMNTTRKLELATKQPVAHQRTRTFAREVMQEDRCRMQRQFDDALEELHNIDVFLIDAVRGLALIPFRRDDNLAWFVFDQFTNRGVIGWRFHDDPIDECRSLRLLHEPNSNDPVSN